MTPEEIATRLKELEREAESIDKERTAREQAEMLPRMEQHVADMRAVNKLEAEHGHNRVGVATLKGWTPGCGAATLIAVVVPKRSDHRYQKFQQQILAHRKNPHGTTKAIEELGSNAIGYPHKERDRELYDATLEIAPVMLNTAADMAADLADADDKADAKKSLRS
jgi:hypothetical protein